MGFSDNGYNCIMRIVRTKRISFYTHEIAPRKTISFSYEKQMENNDWKIGRWRLIGAHSMEGVILLCNQCLML